MPSSPSSSSSASSSPEPEEVISLIQKPKAAKKHKSKADKGRNEGVDPSWAFAPPSGYELVEGGVDAGEFDWDTIANNDDLELCLIRVPENIKPKYLENLTIQTPSSPRKSSIVGSLKRKHATFDVWYLGEDNDDELPVGGEEMRGISCLLPRKSKKGKLYPAPKPITRHLVLSGQAATPSPMQTADSTPAEAIEKSRNPPRESYPKELLKHRFMPYGSLSAPDEKESAPMEVDTTHSSPKSPESPKKKHTLKEETGPSKEQSKKEKSKKRKSSDHEASRPKKSKKAKTTS